MPYHNQLITMIHDNKPLSPRKGALILLWFFIFSSTIIIWQLSKEYSHIKHIVNLGRNGKTQSAFVYDIDVKFTPKWFNSYYACYKFIPDGNFVKNEITSCSGISKKTYDEIQKNSFQTITYNYNNPSDSYFGDIRDVSFNQMVITNKFYYLAIFCILLAAIAGAVSQVYDLLKLNRT